MWNNLSSERRRKEGRKKDGVGEMRMKNGDEEIRTPGIEIGR